MNLGTPDSPHPSDVKRYLTEFLMDGRVIDLQKILRTLLVRGLIIPRRYKASAALYSSIWSEHGSPLYYYGKKTEQLLQEKLGEKYLVKLAMRYRSPSIEEGLEQLKGCKRMIILPLFPQYASATTGSVHQKIFETLSKWFAIPEVRFVSQFPDHPNLIEAFAERAHEWNLQEFDHFVFSYHGLPLRQVEKGYSENPSTCYPSNCFATTKAIVSHLGIPDGKWSQSFQSRLGKSPWLEPYTDLLLKELVSKNKKRVLVFCPSFVADCLETLQEIGSEYKHEFIENGGERLELVKGLNDHPKWIETLESIVYDRTY